MFLVWLLVTVASLGVTSIVTFRTARSLARSRTESDLATRLSGFAATPFFLITLGCAYKANPGVAVVLITAGVGLVVVISTMSYGFKAGGRMDPPD